MAEHVDVRAVAADILRHKRVVAMKRCLFALTLVVGRVVDILPVDDVLRADDDVKRRLLEEAAIALKDGLVHADLDAEVQALAAIGLIGLPVSLRIEGEVHLARVVEVEVLGEREPDARLPRLLDGIGRLHLGVRREGGVAVAVKDHRAPQSFSASMTGTLARMMTIAMARQMMPVRRPSQPFSVRPSTM